MICQCNKWQSTHSWWVLHVHHKVQEIIFDFCCLIYFFVILKVCVDPMSTVAIMEYVSLTSGFAMVIMIAVTGQMRKTALRMEVIIQCFVCDSASSSMMGDYLGLCFSHCVVSSFCSFVSFLQGVAMTFTFALGRMFASICTMCVMGTMTVMMDQMNHNAVRRERAQQSFSSHISLPYLKITGMIYRKIEQNQLNTQT